MGGFAICIGGGAVQWGSRLHPHVSLSSTESEYTTVSKVGCEVMWMRYLLGEFGYDILRPSPILVDNVSAIQVAKHLEHQSTMKHVHRTYSVDSRPCCENRSPGFDRFHLLGEQLRWKPHLSQPLQKSAK